MEKGPGAGVANMKANRQKEKLSFSKLYKSKSAGLPKLLILNC